MRRTSFSSQRVQVQVELKLTPPCTSHGYQMVSKIAEIWRVLGNLPRPALHCLLVRAGNKYRLASRLLWGCLCGLGAACSLTQLRSGIRSCCSHKIAQMQRGQIYHLLSSGGLLC